MNSFLHLYLQIVPFILLLSEQFHRIDGLDTPGYPVVTTVLMDSVTETPCSFVNGVCVLCIRTI
jgi:hypothetical protein